MRIALWTCIFLCVASVVFGQETRTDHPTVSNVLERKTGGKWGDRRKALEDSLELMRSGKLTHEEDDQLRLGMIQLLLKESTGGLKEPDDEPQTDAAQNDDEYHGEEKGDYYSRLISVVAGMHDERAIPALLEAAGIGGIATRAIAGFGTKALDATLAQIGSKDPDDATGALHVVGDMLEFRTVSDAESLVKIKKALHSALSSPEYRVRENVMFTIEYLQDKDRGEFVPILQEIAVRDPYNGEDIPIVPGTGKNDRHFVRQHAKQLLSMIANHEHEPPVVDQGIR